MARPRRVAPRAWRSGLFLVALTVLFAPASAAAQGLRRLDAAWLLPERLAARAPVPATPVTWVPPAAGWWARAGQARLHGLRSLPSRRLAVGLAAAGGAWAAEGAWETLGQAPLHDDLAQARLQAGRRWFAGLTARWRRVQVGGAPPWRSRTATLDLGLCWARGPLGAGTARLSWPLAGDDSAPGAGPQERLLVALAGGGRALALGVDTDPSGRPHVGWEALWALAGGVGLSWRVDPASGALGGGLRLARGRLRIRTSHLAHPDLGLTHRCEIALGAAEASPW